MADTTPPPNLNNEAPKSPSPVTPPNPSFPNTLSETPLDNPPFKPLSDSAPSEPSSDENLSDSSFEDLALPLELIRMIGAESRDMGNFKTLSHMAMGSREMEGEFGDWLKKEKKRYSDPQDEGIALKDLSPAQKKLVRCAPGHTWGGWLPTDFPHNCRYLRGVKIRYFAARAGSVVHSEDDDIGGVNQFPGVHTLIITGVSEDRIVRDIDETVHLGVRKIILILDAGSPYYCFEEPQYIVTDLGRLFPNMEELIVEWKVGDGDAGGGNVGGSPQELGRAAGDWLACKAHFSIKAVVDMTPAQSSSLLSGRTPSGPKRSSIMQSTFEYEIDSQPRLCALKFEDPRDQMGKLFMVSHGSEPATHRLIGAHCVYFAGIDDVSRPKGAAQFGQAEECHSANPGAGPLSGTWLGN